MEFPKWIYLRKDNKAVQVKNENEEARHGILDQDYAYKPYTEVAVTSAGATLAPGVCASCEALRAEKKTLIEKFDAKWAELLAERDALATELSALKAKGTGKKAATAAAADPKPEDSKSSA